MTVGEHVVRLSLNAGGENEKTTQERHVHLLLEITRRWRMRMALHKAPC